MAHSDSHDGLAARPLMELHLQVAAPVDLGHVDGAGARLIPIVGGTVSGGFTGRILPGGADWQVVRPDGSLEIRARYVAEMDAGLVEIVSEGVRTAEPAVLARLAAGEVVNSSSYYFRTAMRFRSSAPALHRLNGILAVSLGQRLPDSVHLRVFEIQ